MELTIKQLAKRIGAELISSTDEADRRINAVADVESAGENTVTFIADTRFISRLKKSNAGAVIVANRIDGLNMPQLVVRNVNAALIETLNIFAPKLKAAP